MNQTDSALASRHTKILLDTDIGNDIDDTLTLAYLLARPDCELLGITTRKSSTWKRAALADHLCRAAGRSDIPIRAGAPGPLYGGFGVPDAPQYEAIADLPHSIEFDRDAVGLLREQIQQRPGQVTLLAIGPLTNVALLVRTHPESIEMIDRLVVMDGVFRGIDRKPWGVHGGFSGGREYNFHCDPLAAAIVCDAFRKAPGKLTLVGLDVTLKCQIDAATAQARLSADRGVLQAVNRIAEVWYRQTGHVTFHDPLAAALIFDPDLCTYADGLVEVETGSIKMRGVVMLHTENDPQGKPHRIALGVRTEAFFEHYFAAIDRLATRDAR